MSDDRYGTGTTVGFISLSARISGRDLDSFVNTWLYTPGKPTSW